MAKLIKNIPIAASGLAFGIVSLGWNWEKFHPLKGIIQIPSAILAVAIIILVSIKLWQSTFNFSKAIENNNIGPIAPTLPLVVMITSVNFTGYTALLLWLSAVIVHTAILFYFIVTRFRTFDFTLVSPTWFIPFVAISIAAFTNPGLAFLSQFISTFTISELLPTLLFNQIVLFFAITSYLLLLPLILSRIITRPRLFPNTHPSLVLVAAPANLSLLGYLTFFEATLGFLFYLLLALAVSMTMASYFCIWKQRHSIFPNTERFSPAISSFTFPLVIGAPTMQATSDFLATLYSKSFLVDFFSHLANIQLYLAATVTFLVFLVYIKHVLFMAPEH